MNLKGVFSARFRMADDSVDLILDSVWLPRAEGSRVFDSDWLPRRVGNVLGYGAERRKPSQCIKISNACIKMGNSIR